MTDQRSSGSPEAPPPRPSQPGTLWRHRDFVRLWAAQAISAFGSRITRTALPIIAVKTLGEPEAIVGMLAALQLAPGVVLAMVAGGFVDRGHKRRILIGADVFRAVLVASLTLAWAFGALSMLHVIVVGALVGAASALFQITDVAYLPALIGRRRLVEGNAKLEATEAIAEITGPASAGALIAALGAPLAVAIDAASYVWSAVMLGRIRAREQLRPASATEPRDPAGARLRATPTPASSATPSATRLAISGGAAVLPVSSARPVGDDTGQVALPPRTGEDFRIGMRAVFGHPLVRPIVLSLMVWSIAGGFFMALYTLFCLRELGLSEATFGVIIAMGGIGSLAGALISRWLARTLGVGKTLVLTSILSLTCALFIPIAGLAGSRSAAIGFLLAHQLLSDGFAVAFIILAVTLRQTVLPKEVLGRANAAIHVCTTGVLPVAAVIAGGLAELIGIRPTVWIGVLVGMLAPILLWPLRRLRDMPSPELSASDSAMAQVSASGSHRLPLQDHG